jgi:hypothetical protein
VTPSADEQRYSEQSTRTSTREAIAPRAKPCEDQEPQQSPTSRDKKLKPDGRPPASTRKQPSPPEENEAEGLDYWRELAIDNALALKERHSVSIDERRMSIKSVEYWKTEALFLKECIENDDRRRKKKKKSNAEADLQIDMNDFKPQMTSSEFRHRIYRP